jgi:hypothetical protein
MRRGPRTQSQKARILSRATRRLMKLERNKKKQKINNTYNKYNNNSKICMTSIIYIFFTAETGFYGDGIYTTTELI